MDRLLKDKAFSKILAKDTISRLLKGEDDFIFNLDGSEYNSTSPEMFFRDGKRRIDFVLVYKNNPTNENLKSQRFAFLHALAEQMIEIEVETCSGDIIAKTGPRNAGFNEMSGFTLHTKEDDLDATGDMVTDKTTFVPKPQYDASEDDDDINPLETAILAHDDLVFVKLHASWTAMIRVAEILQLRKPLKQGKLERLELTEGAKCSRCFELDHKEVLKLPRPYRAAFNRTRMRLFDIPEDLDSFFTPSERILVLDYVLRRTGTFSLPADPAARAAALEEASASDTGNPVYLTEQQVELEREIGVQPGDIRLAQKGKIDLGINHLINEKVFVAAFPLHEPSVELQQLLLDRKAANNGVSPTDDLLPGPSQPPPSDHIERNMRIMLSEKWATFKSITKFQPLDYVRLYFGESIAFYFAWLGLYTYWLIPVGIFGLLVFCLSAIDIADDRIVDDVCLRGGEFVMCPPCNKRGCKMWLLNTSCFATKMTHLVDNIGTVLFAVFMAIWATLFMENWKRYQTVLAYRWNVQHLAPIDEPPRPEFLALIKKRGYKTRINLITGREEPYVPFWSRKIPIATFSFSAVLFGMLLCLAALIGVIFYRLVVNTILLQNENAFVSSVAGMITTVTSSMINLICIFILKKVYDKISVKLTDMENHRTQSEYDNSLTLKLYLLQFVNYYSSIFYIAFIQGTTAGLPGDDSVPIRSSGCDNGNCLFQLFIQLAIIMVGKQFLNFVTENALPPVRRCLEVYFAHKRASKNIVETAPTAQYGSIENAEAEKASKPGTFTPVLYNCRLNYTLFDGGSRPLFEEYLEMLIQYGFITMFVPAFPVAPLFALLNNMFEVRTDAKKFLRVLRRPVVKRENGIGVWFSILTAVSSLAIRTNACLIAFTSEYLVRMTYIFYYSPNRSLEGYLNFTLSYMNTSRFELSDKDRAILGNSTYCRYKDFREPPTSDDPYAYTPVYWHILAIKFAFVFIFENVAIVLTGLIARLIPDVPQSLTIISRHEARVINELLLNTEDYEDEEAKDGLRPFSPPTQQPKIGFYGTEEIMPKRCLDGGVGCL